MSPERHLVFDLGKVLVHFSYSELFPLLRRRGALIGDVEEFAARVGLADYEQGRLSNEQFLQRLNALLSAPLTLGELEKAWCAIFSPLPQMLALVRRMRRQAKTYIISNTSDIHWRYLHERFALGELCDDSLASFEIGAMKPAATIYRAAEERFGFRPEQAVFIDDRVENVTGARACGWHGIHHRSYGQTRDALTSLGLPP